MHAFLPDDIRKVELSTRNNCCGLRADYRNLNAGHTAPRLGRAARTQPSQPSRTRTVTRRDSAAAARVPLDRH
ncbi:hypothetical protein V5799_026166 [Amblyomma americanum]|uniref:Uncharacterized protein n=1 Tax=Amblyomma americanum TaxID=6943 RepID=A0AAQ4DJC4_AMBAM